MRYQEKSEPSRREVFLKNKQKVAKFMVIWTWFVRRSNPLQPEGFLRRFLNLSALRTINKTMFYPTLTQLSNDKRMQQSLCRRSKVVNIVILSVLIKKHIIQNWSFLLFLCDVFLFMLAMGMIASCPPRRQLSSFS